MHREKITLCRVQCYLWFQASIQVLECTPMDKGGLLYLEKVVCGKYESQARKG